MRPAKPINYLPVVTLPDPVLRAPTKRIAAFDRGLQELIEAMRITMRAADGIGLAAPQIGQSLKLAVIEYQGESEEADQTDQPQIPFLVIANPTIVHLGNEFEIFDEGCLSIPGLQIPIPRATEVRVIADNQAGERIRIRARGLFARILQHEIDHLNGLLIVDRTTDKKIRKQYAPK